MNVLGVSCDYHDAAAALVVDGEVIAAIEEERLTRLKHDSSLPANAISSCLAIGGIRPDDLDAVVFHEKPFAVAARVVAAHQRRGPRGWWSFTEQMPRILGRNLFVGYRIERALADLGATGPPHIVYSNHHLSHAAAAFLPSPYPSAAILTIDAIGEWATASIGVGVHGRVELLSEQRYPNSLGLLYSLATQWCGFTPNDGEYKLMGLAPYGEPTFTDALAELVDIGDDGSIGIDSAAVRFWGSGLPRSGHLASLLGGPPRSPDDLLTSRDMNLARSVQELTERVVLSMAEHAHSSTEEENLCLAGGVALNCVANGRLLRDGPFDDIWIQPAAGDAGSALGAALWWAHEQQPTARKRSLASASSAGDGLRSDGMCGSALGPRFDSTEIKTWLDEQGIEHETVEDNDDLHRRVARRIADGGVVGWFSGRMEFGPRSLGHRSILADPRSDTAQHDINVRVKGRESFRPFAPAVLWEHAREWFDLDRPAPYMLVTTRVAADKLIPVDEEPESIVDRVRVPRSLIPSCTHIDGSARVQTVHRVTNPEFHSLLSAFEELTGCPVLLNTSFNRAGEPIVCTPDDALRSAHHTQLDVLVLENHLIDLMPTDDPL